jgi:hypothetical protein
MCCQLGSVQTPSLSEGHIIFKHLFLAIAFIACSWGSSALALDRCVVGQRAIAPGGPATVVAIQNGGVDCTVHIDGRPSTIRDTYGAFLLDPIASPPQAKVSDSRPKAAPKATSSARAGAYQCSSSTAGITTFVVQAGGRYANGRGASGTMRMTGPHRDRPAWQTFALVGGPLDGFYGAIMDGGRIGLTSQANASFYNMTCDVPAGGSGRGR